MNGQSLDQALADPADIEEVVDLREPTHAVAIEHDPVGELLTYPLELGEFLGASAIDIDNLIHSRPLP